MDYRRIEELVILSKQGDKKALEGLINTYEKLIRKYTATYFIKDYDSDDLQQVANLAIVQAVQKYDITKGANFTSFVDIFLRNTFTTIIRRKENKVTTVSLNKVVYDDGEDFKEYVDILIDDINIEENFEKKEQHLELLMALNTLSQEEQEILFVAYGKHGWLKEYGRRKGISYGCCRNRRDRALENIKKIIKK